MRTNKLATTRCPPLRSHSSTMSLSAQRLAAASAVLTLLLAVSSDAAGPAGAADGVEVVQQSDADAAASRSLLRAASVSKPVLSITWTLRTPITRWVRAGSVVRFTWTRAGGLAYGYSRCKVRGTLARPSGRGTVLVKIPRGGLWFFDNYRSNCSKQAIYIIGY